MTISAHRSISIWLALTLIACACSSTAPQTQELSRPAAQMRESVPEDAMLVQYLEVVTSDVDATCKALAQLHGVTFSEADAALGNARTAALASGGRIGVRAPLAAHEEPGVRPYVLVDDIESAVGNAEAAGAVIAMASTELAGHGKFAIYILGGIQHGLWQH